MVIITGGGSKIKAAMSAVVGSLTQCYRSYAAAMTYTRCSQAGRNTCITHVTYAAAGC